MYVDVVDHSSHAYGPDIVLTGFRVLSEAERTAALYSLLQHSTQVQIRFFITVLQQMARSDPMTALLSPGMGGSMQAQMEAKLLSMGLKSPALKAPASPSTRNFSTGPSANTNGNNFLTPDAALASPSPDAAATLAQQRARLKASNADAASRRISAPGTLSNGDGRNVWQPPQLGQLAERAPSPVAEQSPPSPSLGPNSISAVRPKSTDFTGVANQFKNRTASGGTVDAEAPGQDLLSPMGGGNWASMVNTPLVPMFSETNKPNLESASGKLSTWSANKSAGTGGSANGRIALADAKSFRRTSKGTPTSPENAGVYGDDGNLLVPGNSPSVRSPNKSAGGNGATGFNQQMWPGMQRSPGLASATSGRFGGGDEQQQMSAGMPFGMGMAGSPLGMSPLMGGMGGMGGMGMGGMGVGGFNTMNMMNLGMGMDPMQAQYLAAQIAAGQFGAQFAAAAGMQGQGMMGRGGRSGTSARMGGGGAGGGSSSKSANGRDAGNKEKEEEVDPTLLNDVPGWLRSLRLHKYTPNFEGMSWQDMVKMDEDALEARGVAALGARRKMLKTFELVRAKMGIEE